MTKATEEQDLERHYSARLQTWIDEYDRPQGYPFAKVRLARIRRRLEAKRVAPRSVLDVGCGVGIPGLALTPDGGRVYGFDLSPELVGYARRLAGERKVEATYAVGSLTDPAAYPDGRFDLVLSLGVFQHVRDDRRALELMKGKMAPDGWMVLSLRNPLFGLITFNRPSYELFREMFAEFLQGPDGAVLDGFLRERLALDQPPPRKGGGADVGIDDVVYRFHNPFTLSELLEGVGLRVDSIDFYRHHAMPPLLEGRSPDRFREISLGLDDQPNDWRSMFLCSTYIVYVRHAG